MRRRTDLIMEDVDDAATFDGSKKRRPNIHNVPPSVCFGLVVMLLGLYGLVYTVDNNLPTPLHLADEKTHPEGFITERAHHDLKLITQLGPRVVGSYENEVLAVDFLKREISFIMRQAHVNQKLELDLQVVSGSHYLKTRPHGKFVSYSNLQNIIVKLYSRHNVSHSVLVNAHFDSVATSPGSSDDGINCAVMLEILRKLSKEPQRPLNNIIFLFNGAEETGLQAAHGFITQHKWAQESKVVLNLEATGAGGKIIMFQSGPDAPWLLKYYSQVPHPYAQAAGEEIFQSNLVPSDTDFRIFRDNGGLVGFDMAFIKNGYRYHTKYDDLEHIPLGSFQHVGDNALSLIRSFANAPEVSNPKRNPGKTVFFDFLGLFMVSYSQTTGSTINYITVILSFVVFGLSVHTFKLGYSIQTVKYLAITFGTIIGGWIAATGFIALTTVVIDGTGYSMSWYGNSWLMFGLYAAPVLGFSSIFLPYITQKNLSENIKSQIQAHCVRIIWSVILFIGTLLNVRAVYALLISVFFNTIGFLLIHILRLQHTGRKWQIIYVSFLIVPTIFLMYTTITTMTLFIPMTGRIGSDKNADLIMGMMSLFFTVLITSPFVALTTTVRNFQYLLIFLGAAFLISFVFIFTPLGFPYSGNPKSPTPQRYWILHTRRVFHGEDGTETRRDSGYFLLNMDRNSPGEVKNYVTDIVRARSLAEDCEKYLLCGLPLVHAKMIQIIEFSTWIPAGQPIISEPVKLTVVSKDQLSSTTFRYNLSILGPDRIGIYISPKVGAKIIDTNLANKMPPAVETAKWNGRDLNYIIHIYGKEAGPLQFSFDVQVPDNFSEIATEIAVSGIYVHDNKNRKVPHYVQFLNEFPDWTEITAWLGSYESWWI